MPEWFDDLRHGSTQAARKVLPILWRLHSFKSVIDIGCGAGAWLKIARDLGATLIRGVEGTVLPPEFLCVPAETIHIADLEKPLPIADRFELCIALEVAEHLSPERAESFVGELASLADVVLFSAAIPFQGGYHHLNEQWPDFWARHFSNSGFDVWDGIRKEIWSEQDIPWWYRQNILLFAKRSIWAQVLPHEKPTAVTKLSIVHPECYVRRPSKL